MTLQETTAILTPLALALGADLDRPTYVVYHRVLEDVPAGLLQAAVDDAARSPRAPYAPRFPTPGDLRQLAEAARRRLSAAHVWRPCEACRDLRPGWVAVVDPAGDTRLDRCPCWRAHQARLARTGVSVVPVALLEDGPRELGDDEVRGD